MKYNRERHQAIFPDRSSNGGRGRGTKLCTHYGQTNHAVDNCWKKYGYPPHLHHLQQGGVANNYVNTNGNEEGQSVAYI
jgi:hypothetical protein